jgi:glutamate-1-semialdehyde aminotransferase/acyl carrier protein
LSPPRIDIISTVTGRWMTPEQATDPAYWGRHLRAPVRFAEGIQAVWQVPDRVLLEVGPGTASTIFARQQMTDITRQMAIPSLGTAATDDAESMALCTALGQLWLTGARPDWKRYYQAEQRHRLALPTYPFERKRFWLDPAIDTIVDGPEQLSPAQQPTEDIPLPRSEVRRVSSTSEPMRLLKGILEHSTGLDMDRIDEGTTFVEMGLDSLALAQIAQRLQKQFNLRITFRQLVEAYPNLNTLAALLAQAYQPETLATADGATAGAPQRQLVSVGNPFSSVDDGRAPSTTPGEPTKPFGAAARIVRRQSQHLTPTQKAFLDRLIGQYTRRTAESKAYVQAHRLQFADPRTVSGFDPALKELVYPLVASRSSGTRIWDLDGNEYIDVVSGFGSSLFGYLPPFIKEAMQGQLERGMEVGPQTPLAGEVAELICELTHLDRATFCNTGSEAVLGAMRLARTVTGRSKVALFSGSYHGIFDEVLVRGTKQLRPIPASPGVTQEAVDNILVVDYATPEALQILEARIGELAAVLVEPVQSRRPELQPRTFLHLLRRLTERGGAALIVDEMITGFRIHQGGAQAHFGIRADLATYGKIVGGGMPIGVLAGTAKFMDAIDGGYWQFGDASAPEVDITYFAGTFVRHPLAIAAAKAALEYLKAAGPALQQDLNARSDDFAAELNRYFTKVRAPMHLVNCGSLLKLELQGTVPLGSLLYYVLRSKGIHIGEHRPFFFTTAHTVDDLTRIAAIFKESVWELQQAGFLLPPEAGPAHEPSRGTHLSQVAPLPGARLGRDPQGKPGWYVPDDTRPGKYLKIEASTPSSTAEPDMENGDA